MVYETIENVHPENILGASVYRRIGSNSRIRPNCDAFQGYFDSQDPNDLIKRLHLFYKSQYAYQFQNMVLKPLSGVYRYPKYSTSRNAWFWHQAKEESNPNLKIVQNSPIFSVAKKPNLDFILNKILQISPSEQVYIDCVASNSLPRTALNHPAIIKLILQQDIVFELPIKFEFDQDPIQDTKLRNDYFDEIRKIITLIGKIVPSWSALMIYGQKFRYSLWDCQENHIKYIHLFPKAESSHRAYYDFCLLRQIANSIDSTLGPKLADLYWTWWLPLDKAKMQIFQEKWRTVKGESQFHAFTDELGILCGRIKGSNKHFTEQGILSHNPVNLKAARNLLVKFEFVAYLTKGCFYRDPILFNSQTKSGEIENLNRVFNSLGQIITGNHNFFYCNPRTWGSKLYGTQLVFELDIIIIEMIKTIFESLFIDGSFRDRLNFLAYDANLPQYKGNAPRTYVATSVSNPSFFLPQYNPFIDEQSRFFIGARTGELNICFPVKDELGHIFIERQIRKSGAELDTLFNLCGINTRGSKNIADILEFSKPGEKFNGEIINSANNPYVQILGDSFFFSHDTFALSQYIDPGNLTAWTQNILAPMQFLSLKREELCRKFLDHLAISQISGYTRWIEDYGGDGFAYFQHNDAGSDAWLKLGAAVEYKYDRYARLMGKSNSRRTPVAIGVHCPAYNSLHFQIIENIYHKLFRSRRPYSDSRPPPTLIDALKYLCEHFSEPEIHIKKNLMKSIIAEFGFDIEENGEKFTWLGKIKSKFYQYWINYFYSAGTAVNNSNIPIFPFVGLTPPSEVLVSFNNKGTLQIKGPYKVFPNLAYLKAHPSPPLIKRFCSFFKKNYGVDLPTYLH